eukprot:PhF_6_TR32131/c0_g1_i1/m.47574
MSAVHPLGLPSTFQSRIQGCGPPLIHSCTLPPSNFVLVQRVTSLLPTLVSERLGSGNMKNVQEHHPRVLSKASTVPETICQTCPSPCRRVQVPMCVGGSATLRVDATHGRLEYPTVVVLGVPRCVG